MYVSLGQLVRRLCEGRDLRAAYAVLRASAERCASGATVHKIGQLLAILRLAVDMDLVDKYKEYERELIQFMVKRRFAGSFGATP